MPSATVAPRTTAFTGSGTLLSVTPSAGLTDFSLHDCADPGHASIMNCIYPLGTMPGGPTTAGLSFKVGLTVHSRSPQTLTITVGKS